jgi:hypothetical protein
MSTTDPNTNSSTDPAPEPRSAASFRLGWKPGPADPRTLKLANYATPASPPPPASADWMSRVEHWPMLANDQCGDCELAAFAHLIQAWTTYGGKPLLVSQRDVVAAYSAISGYNPRTGVPDPGCESLKALNYWRKTGLGPAGAKRRIAAFVKIDHRNLIEVKAAIVTFGGIIIAAEMPLTAQTQFDAKATWTAVSGRRAQPGSWGGHAMHLGSYGTRGFSVSTWGRRQQATWDWWETYVDEAWAVVSNDWLTAAGSSPSGFDAAGLLDDLHRILAL